VHSLWPSNLKNCPYSPLFVTNVQCGPRRAHFLPSWHTIWRRRRESTPTRMPRNVHGAFWTILILFTISMGCWAFQTQVTRVGSPSSLSDHAGEFYSHCFYQESLATSVASLELWCVAQTFLLFYFHVHCVFLMFYCLNLEAINGSVTYCKCLILTGVDIYLHLLRTIF